MPLTIFGIGGERVLLGSAGSVAGSDETVIVSCVSANGGSGESVTVFKITTLVLTYLSLLISFHGSKFRDLGNLILKVSFPIGVFAHNCWQGEETRNQFGPIDNSKKQWKNRIECSKSGCHESEAPFVNEEVPFSQIQSFLFFRQSDSSTFRLDNYPGFSRAFFRDFLKSEAALCFENSSVECYNQSQLWHKRSQKLKRLNAGNLNAVFPRTKVEPCPSWGPSHSLDKPWIWALFGSDCAVA